MVQKFMVHLLGILRSERCFSFPHTDVLKIHSEATEGSANPEHCDVLGLCISEDYIWKYIVLLDCLAKRNGLFLELFKVETCAFKILKKIFMF